MRKGLFLLIAIFSITVVKAQRQIIDQVVATIGSEYILLSEVEEQFALMSSQQGSIPDDTRCVIMDNLLAQNLLLHQAKLDSIEVADEEVETQLDARIERILGYMGGNVQQFEDYYGQTIGEVKEEFRDDLRSQIMTDRMKANIISNVAVTPSDVKTFYNQIPKDSLPYFNSEVEIGEIVYYPKVNSEERQKVIDQLTDIRRQIVEESVSFEEMAKKYSQDGSARLGGDLGWSKRGQFVLPFEAAAYNLEENEISDLVESEFGFHIIQLLGRRGNTIHTRHILIKPEITYDDLDKAESHLDSVRQLVATDSIDFSRAVKQFSSDKEQSYNNDGRMVNPTTGNTFFEIGDLDPDIYFTIDTMEVGELSAPIEFRNATGERGFRIVQLQSRTSPHKANLRQDYSKIQKATIEAKKNEFINKWVDERIGATFINISSRYETCPTLNKWEKNRASQ